VNKGPPDDDAGVLLPSHLNISSS